MGNKAKEIFLHFLRFMLYMAPNQRSEIDFKVIMQIFVNRF